MNTEKKQPLTHHIKVSYVRSKSNIHNRKANFLARRPHRSFRRTRRRDYRRSLKLPGYFAFIAYVNRTLWKNKKTFLLLALAYALLSAVLVSVMSENTYTNIRDSVTDTTSELANGNWGSIGNASLVLLAVVNSFATGAPDTSQQVFTVLLILMVWLTTVWLLRNILAGNKVKVRDGIYNASAPLISTFIVLAILIIQLIPMAVGLITGVVALQTGFLSNGGVAMIFWLGVGSLAILSLYWITASFIGLVVVTLPGMYPLKALAIAGDMVVGRRLRILLRILWALLVLALGWLVIMVPLILFDAWLKSVASAVNWLPTIPIALLVMASLTIIWLATYIYLLYRKVVDDDALPA